MSTDLIPVEQRSSFDLLPQAFDLAQKISQTDFVPRALRGKPEAVMACVLAGHEMGIGPMQSLQKIHVIEGRPGPSAELMRAIVLAAGHEVWFEESTVTRVTICGRRSGGTSTTTVTWTMDDAKRAGLAGKSPWRSYPRAMLTARATGELCRAIFPDVLAGLTYTAEELEDGFDEWGPAEPAETATAAPEGNVRSISNPPAKKAAAKKAAPKKRAPTAPPPAADLPPLPGEDDEDIEDAVVVDEATKRRNQQIAMRANELGVDRADVIYLATGGRKTSARECDAAEAAEVLEILRRIKVGTAQVVQRDGEPVLADVEPGEAPEASDGGDVAEWDSDRWKAELRARGVPFVPTLKEAKRLAVEMGAEEPGSLGDLAGQVALAACVLAWVEEQVG